MKQNEKIPLIVGLSIPLLMVVFIGLSIYLPGLFAKPPQYDFIYACGGDSYSLQKYTVKNKKLVIADDLKYPDHFAGVKADPRLFVHSVAKNESREISLEDAQKLILNDYLKSPDGFEVVAGGYDGGIFFSGSNYGKQYIKGHNISRELNVQQSSSAGSRYYCYNCFDFIGWIER